MNKLIEIGKKHNIDIEIFKEKHNSTDISTLNDKIKLFQITNVSKYIIKAIRDNRCVKIVTESIKNSEELINTLEDIFKTSDNKNSNRLCTGNIKNKLRKKEIIDYSKVKEVTYAPYYQTYKDDYSKVNVLKRGAKNNEI
jgi:predicted Zn-dependent protease